MSGKVSIHNDDLSVNMEASGKYHCVTRTRERPLFNGATVSVESQGETETAMGRDVARRVWTEDGAGRLGHRLGSATSAFLHSEHRHYRVITCVRLYEKPIHPGIALLEIGATLTNTGSDPLELDEVVPFHIPEGGAVGRLFERALYLSSEPEKWRILTHGHAFYDPGTLRTFEQNNDLFYSDARCELDAINSYWHVAIHDPTNLETLVIGSLAPGEYETLVSLKYPSRRQHALAHKGVSIRTRARERPGFLLQPGESRAFDGIVVLFGVDPHAVLESYANLLAEYNGVTVKPEIPMGWCSWFCYGTENSEDEVLRNADFVANNLVGYGVDLIQIDDGYQKRWGDWEANDNFPDGIGATAERIRKLGLTPGIWVAPWFVSLESALYRELPDALIKNEDGSTYVHQSRRGPYAVLDTTHPKGKAWLAAVFRRIASDWRFAFVKTDFSYVTCLAVDNYSDRNMGRARAYHECLALIKSTLGPSIHLLDCGPLSAIGNVDSMRIELDTARLDWNQYSRETARGAAHRYMFHRRIWINDADHLGIALLNDSQAQAACTLIALSGGTVMLGDRLYAISADRLRTLTSALPAYGAAARPLDLFEREIPEKYHLRVQKESEAWDVVAIFNWSSGVARDAWLDLSSVGVERGRSVAVHEFWTQSFEGVCSEGFGLRIPPESVRIVALRPVNGEPVVLGTDRHVLQGAVELDEVIWDGDALRGLLHGHAGREDTVTFYVPARFQLRGITCDGADVGYERRGDLLRVRMNSSETDRVRWAVRLSETEG